ncbi:MAG TPA: hypothetical protein VNH21_03165 [Steroidobacteraceae bacterium]|nr:hypothetical protein [Steroidobacteraceae bacterium]
MPIVDLEAPSPFRISGRPEGFAVTPGEDDLTKGSDAPDTSPGSVAAAAFRQNNMIASAITRKDWGAEREVEPGFNPWDAIKGTKYEPHWNSFVDIRSSSGADARKRQLDMEDEDRRTLAAANWSQNLVMGLLAGTADPTVLLPAGEFVRGVKGGISIAGTALKTGAAAGGAAALQETGLHATQQLRETSESAMNIGASVFLGGLLGAGGAKLLSHAEWNTAVAGLNRDLGVTAKAPIAGGPLHEIVLAHPDVSEAIANPKINRTQDVPYTAGPDKTGPGLNIDQHFPHEFTVEGKTFDPAQPFAVHEFSERHAMEKLIAGGMDQETAYKVAHWEVAEPAEGGWYEANGIDQGKAEAAYQPFIDQIEHEKLAKGDGDVPRDLYRKPYPHDSVDAAAREKAPVPKPTAEEAARGREILAQGEAKASGAPASVGAAAQEPVTIEGNAIAGRAAGAVAAATAKLNPLLRLMQSPSATVREVAGKLFENPLYLKKNFEGVASEPAVETLMKEWNGGLVKALQSTEGAWRDYRKAGGQLSKTEFREAVGRAMRRKDESEIPEVAKVAKAWRSQVFDPLKEAAIKAGLLPEDVSVDTAASYFSRMWNRNRLIAQEGRFKGIVSDHYSGVIGREYDKATASTRSRLAKLDQEIADLTLSAEGRAEQLSKVEAELAAHEEAGDAYQGFTEKADRLGELAGEMRKAKDAGDTAALEAARAEAKAIKEQGGKALKEFMAERAALRTRRRNIDLGAAGISERAQAIAEGLADLEEANQRSMQRLVKRGQVLERDLDKIDPDVLAERIGGMRDSFISMAQKHDAAADRADQAIAKIKEDAQKRAERADVREDKEAAPVVPARKAGLSLLAFIRKRGGIAASDALAGDVKGLGLGRMLSKRGVPLDRLREAAVEAGYLTDEGARGGGVSTSTVNDLLDSMGAEARGNKVYIPGEEPLPEIRPPVGGGPLGRSEKGSQILDAAEAKIIDRLEKHAAEQRARAERMETISTRLDIAEDFDREGAVAELRRSIDRSVAEVSNVSLGRGERAQRMQERLAALDPAKVKKRVEVVEQMKRDLQRAYYDRWETKNLGQNVDLFAADKERPDFSDMAREIADTAYNTLTGRTESGVRPEFMSVGTRGPMKDRTFNIPDELIEDFLEHDIDHVGRRYARVMGADVEMAHKFGSVDMKEQLESIRANYDRLRSGVTDEAILAKLGKQERADVDDMTALRDLLRGTRAESPVERNFGKIARVAAHINYIRQMGEVVLASLTDAIRPAMVHGLTPYMATVGQLAKNLDAIKLSVGEAQLAGNVAERILAHRMATLTDIADPYASRGPVEAFMENMSNVASKWNGIRLWTDMMKSFTAVMTQNRILGNVDRFAKIKGSERAYMAMLGIDESMAERIAAQVAKHGETIDGVRVAGTENWTDDVARRTYRAAVNKDMDSIIVQSGKADVPLFSHTPMGKMLLQFQSFNLASHQRVMMRGLQESPTRFIGGTIAMNSMGMLMTYLKALSGNRTEKQEAFTSNPGWWIGEGLDRSGIIPVPMELANRFEKMTGVNPIKGALKVFDKGSAESQKNQNRSGFGSMLGPTVGLGEDIFNVAKIPRTLYDGKDVSQAQKNAAVRLVPFNSYFGWRQMLNYVVNPPH